MSGYTTGAIVAGLLGLSIVVTLVFAAMAGLAGGRPGEDAMTDMGHKAVVWAAGLCAGVVVLLLLLEHAA